MENFYIEHTKYTEEEVKKVNPKNIVIDTDNEHRYDNILSKESSPLSAVCNAYAAEIVNAAINSNLDPRVELKKFYHANFPDLDNDALAYYVTEYFSVNREPDILNSDVRKIIEEQGIEAIYGNGGKNVIVESDGDTYENNSPRR